MTRMRLCRFDELEVGSLKRFELDGAPDVVVAACEGGLHAAVDRCSHEDYPLSLGEVFADVCEIECLRHGSTFSLVDGEPQSLPATRPITVLGVEIVDGDVFVVLP